MPLLHAAIVTAPIDVGALITRTQDDGVGAISVFLGTVRDFNDGRPVTGIEYEAYEAMAARELAAVAEEACAATPGLRVSVEHRVGTLGIGEVSVAIVAAHAHRAQACDGARAVIEALKQRVPIWKREHYVDGDRVWIDPTRTAGGTA
ncbi:molybdenum cofactor biosynthesis protein MoaE [Gemmatimonas aurantiaca]|uniref:molybdenum cofactor biosynthesis protein MoaE n=1 Tax=Gemmatimonas aurantiaca TaxID=173480 RepID=UPI00301CFDC9